MQKHTLHIITSLGQGGAEQQLRYITNGLHDKGCQQTIISLRNNQIGHNFNCKIVYFNFNKSYRFLGQLFKLIKYVKKMQPDIIQTWLYHADLVGFLAGKIVGCKSIYWNIRCSNMNLKLYSPATKLVVNVLAKLSPYVAGIVSNSQAGIDFHQSLGYNNRHWTLIPNGFDTDKYSPQIVARQNYNIPDTAVVFGMVARVDPMKDYNSFILAAKEIVLLHPNTYFVCIGLGTQKFTDPANNILGLGAEDNVHKLLNLFDIFVLTSLSEGLPNVVGEAMACGVPGIVTDVGDTRTLSGEGAIIIPPNSKEELLKAMIIFITMSKDERQAMGAKARKHIISNYNLAKAVERYHELYIEV